MRLVASLAWCLVSGLAATLTFPPQGFWWLSWVALVPWLVALQGATPARAALLSFVFACALAAPLGAWIPGVVLEGFRARPYGAYGLWIVASLSYVPAPVVLGVALSRLASHNWLYPFAAGLGWALVELSYRSLWPRVPWIQLGAPQIDTLIASSAALWGVHGVSVLVVAVNALVAQGVDRAQLRTVVAGGAALVALALGGRFTGALYEEQSSDRLKIAIAQPGIAMLGPGSSRFQHETLAALFELTESLPDDVEVVFWPENSLLSTLEGRPDLARRVATLSDRTGKVLLIGVHRQTQGRRANSAALFEPGQTPRPVYDKQELLPFAEQVPPLVGRLLRGSLGRLTDRLVAGEYAGPVQVGDSTARTLICYEGTFSVPDTPHADLIVNLVNDGWYDLTPAAEHHLLLSRWRAIESGTSLLRAASSGISAIVRPTGELQERAAVRETTALIARVAVSTTLTPFERWGYVPLVLLALVVLGWLGYRTYSKPGGSTSRSAPIAA